MQMRGEGGSITRLSYAYQLRDPGLYLSVSLALSGSVLGSLGNVAATQRQTDPASQPLPSPCRLLDCLLWLCLGEGSPLGGSGAGTAELGLGLVMLH